MILEGAQGPMQVAGKSYNNIMPPFGFLRDEDVTELVNHIRSSFGHQAAPVTIKDGRAARAAQ